jgi:hypothetical protein
MIEKIAGALRINPHALFLEEIDADADIHTETLLTEAVKTAILRDLNDAITSVIKRA